MSSINDNFTIVEILMDDGSKLIRKTDHLKETSEWYDFEYINGKYIENKLYQYDHWMFDRDGYASWWKMNRWPQGWSRCEELPECEKVYQKLVRDKKLERINETVK